MGVSAPAVVSPEVVPTTQQQVGLGEEGGADLTEATVAAAALEAVFMPVLLHGLQQVAVRDLLATPDALPTLDARRLIGLLRDLHHSCKRNNMAVTVHLPQFSDISKRQVFI